jgi:hypothetical protein
MVARQSSITSSSFRYQREVMEPELSLRMTPTVMLVLCKLLRHVTEPLTDQT